MLGSLPMPCRRRASACAHLLLSVLSLLVPAVCQMLRLADGPLRHEGRLEIYHDGVWGTVCRDYFDSGAATVACRQLGYADGEVEATAVPEKYGQGTGPIMLDDVTCTGSELRIQDCQHDGWYNHNCDHNEDIGVKCSTMRLTSVNSVDAWSGRVEVFHNNAWGAVCDFGFDEQDAVVACRQLGYPASRVDAAYYGEAISPRWLSNLECGGSEEAVQDCPHPGWGQQTSSCSPAQVTCGFVRLADPSGYLGNSSGRLEVYHDGQWGTVCSDGFQTASAQVVCKELGFSTGQVLVTGGNTGAGAILMDGVSCIGDEAQLSLCSFDGWGVHDCTHAQDVSVSCALSSVDSTAAIGDLRLAGSTSVGEGRVEIFDGSMWGTICNHNFGDSGAAVACRQLGFQIGVATKTSFGLGSGPIVMDDVECSGNENRLVHCPRYLWQKHNCLHTDDVAVVCSGASSQSQGDLRLVGTGASSRQGRLEVFDGRDWGTVCNDGFGEEEARVACRQLGYTLAEVVPDGRFGYGTGPILMDDVRCSGNEERLIWCTSFSWNVHNCDHSQDVSVACDGVSKNLDGALRLAGSRLEMFYSGRWATICSHGFSHTEAVVACQILGFAGGNITDHIQPGDNSQPIWNHHAATPVSLACDGWEHSLLECQYVDLVNTQCAHTDDVTIACWEGDIRVAGVVTDPPSGRLEVQVDRYVWGTVCDDGFSRDEANAACRTMGWTHGSTIVPEQHGFLPIVLDDVRCAPNERNFLNCAHLGVGVHNCRRDEDVGVTCAMAEVSETDEDDAGSFPGWAVLFFFLPPCCMAIVCRRQICGAFAQSSVAPAPTAPASLFGKALPSLQRKGRLSVRVPPNVSPGMLIALKTPHGNTVQCCVPPGYSPGMIFEVEYALPVDGPLVVDEEAMKGRGSACTASAIPQYWSNVRRPNKDGPVGTGFDQMVHVSAEQHKKFEEMLCNTYVSKATQDRPCPKGTCPRTLGGCKCVQPDGDPGLPTEYCVRRVIRVESSEMWTRYEEKRDTLQTTRMRTRCDRLDPQAVTDEIARSHADAFEPLDADVNEIYLWHGTSVRCALSIAQEDFKIDLAGSSRGTMYGPGTYMAESSTKADEYARDEPDGYYQGIFALLLCRVCMGRFFYTTDRDEQAAEKVKAGDFDSTLGDRAKTAGTFREFVVYDNDQVYPEYIVLYSRIHKGDSPSRKAELSNMSDFHMELPLYWANCHKDPKKDSFHMQFKVQASTLSLLQRLVASCYTQAGRRVRIVAARRIENSDIWNTYAAAKQALRKALASTRDAETGRVSYRRAEELDGNPYAGQVLTTLHLENESSEESISGSQLEAAINELWLWHGTTKAAAESIVRTDFTMPEDADVKHGCRFGKGAYFAEDLVKSLHYAEESGGEKIKTLLLCRVCCGDIYYTEQAVEREAVSNMARLGKHSVLANPRHGGLDAKFQMREFIVSDARQAYPEFILELVEEASSD